MVLKIQMTKVIAKILQWDRRNWEIHAFPFVLRVTRKTAGDTYMYTDY